MAIRPHPSKGPGWWQLVISQGFRKKQRVVAFCGTKAEALAFEAEIRGIPVEARDQKINDVLGRFLDWYQVNRAARTFQEAHNILPKVIKRIGNKHVSLMRQADYTRYKQERLAEGVTKRTINCELSYLSSLLKFAEAELNLPIGDRPKLYSRRQTEPPAKNPLSPQEIGQLIAQLKGHAKTIVMLYAFCGLRRSEATQLTVRQVDLTHNLLRVVGKGNKLRIVPIIGAELADRLKKACDGKQQHDYLFTHTRHRGQDLRPFIDIRQSIKGAATRAGIKKPIWAHLLRHSSATAAIQAGVGLRELQAILGHTDIRMTEIYTHMTGDLLSGAARKMADLHKLSDLSDWEKNDNSSESKQEKTNGNNS